MTFECSEPIESYLAEDSIMDWRSEPIQSFLDASGWRGMPRSAAAEQVFRFVRDEIMHSIDGQNPKVTVSASETLIHQTGLCFAKSHLLAAFLRGLGVPAGLCYQRLYVDGMYVMHGLNAIFLEEFEWFRVDSRRPNASFAPSPDLGRELDPTIGEIDYLTIYASAHPLIVKAMTTSDDALRLCEGGLPTALPA